MRRISRLTPACSPALAETAPTAAVPWFKDYHLVDTEEKFQGFYRRLAKQKRFAFDLEIDQPQPAAGGDRRPGVQSGSRARRGTCGCAGPEVLLLLDPDTTLDRLKPIFEDPKIAKLNQNIKYDLLVLRGKGVEVRGVSGDPMVADYLLRSGERSHNLEELARRQSEPPDDPHRGFDRQEGQETAAAAHGPSSRRRWRPIPARTPTRPGGWPCTWKRSWTGRRSARSTTRWKSPSSRCWPSWSTTASASTPRSCDGGARTWPGSWRRSRKRSTSWPAVRSTSVRCRSAQKSL